MLLFFSSDSTALYKKGIPNVLSLPKGHCVHFRYWDSIIDPDIVNKLNQLKGHEGLIVYVKGNATMPEDQREIDFLPVRRVEVTKCRRDPQTNLIHFSLELGDFIDNKVAQIQYPVPPPTSPKDPFKFVAEGAIIQDAKCNWYKVVENLVEFDPTFNGSLFYHINLLKFEQGISIGIDKPFDEEDESTFFRLSEGDAYILDLSIFISETDLKELEKYECRLDYNQKDVVISNPSNIIIGAPRDNRRYKLITKTVANVHSFDYLKIRSCKKAADDKVDDFYETILHFKIYKSKWKAVWFVALMFLNVIGTAMFTYAIAEKEFWLLPISLIPVLVSALCQFYFYNKS